ncbi:MAG: PRC-barrel domain-containing protein [Kofleriaceae bacterium]
MLRALNDLHGYAIEATDGPIGHVAEVYFDDEKWTVRYLVVKTGSWLDTREVLLSPISLGEPHWETRTLTVRLTKDKIEHSPSIDLHEPVSRQQEARFNDYYGWSSYWGGHGLWARWGTPMMMAMPPPPEDRNRVLDQGQDPHLRSSREIKGYHLHATDAKIGHVADFIIDDATWAIRYLVADTSNWGMGHDVLIAPDWIEAVHADTRIVDVLVPRDFIKSSPKWNPDVPITREYEDDLLAHYRQRQAWSRNPRSNETPIEDRPRHLS